MSLVWVGEALVVGVLLGPLNNASLRFYHEMKVDDEYGTWFTTLLGCYAGVWGILAGLVTVGLGTIRYVWPDARLVTGLTLLGLVLIAGSTLRNVSANLLNVARKRDRYTLVVAVDAWIRPIMAVGLMSMLGAYGLTALLGYALGALASGVLGLGLLLRSEISNLRGDFVFSWPMARSMYGFGWPFIVTSLAAWVMGVLDRGFIGFYYTNSEVGLYAAGYQVGSAFLMMAGSGFMLLVGPILLQSQAHRARVELDLGKAIGAMIVFMVPVAGLIIVFPELLMTLLISSRYHSAQLVTVVRLVAAAMLLGNLQLLAAYGFTLMMKTEKLVTIWSLSATVVLALYALLVPKMAGIGAASATFVGFAFHLGVTVWLGRRALRWPIPYPEMGVACAGVIASTVLSWATSFVYPGVPILVRALLWIAVYVAVAWSMTHLLAIRARRRVNILS